MRQLISISYAVTKKDKITVWVQFIISDIFLSIITIKSLKIGLIENGPPHLDQMDSEFPFLKHIRSGLQVEGQTFTIKCSSVLYW